MTKAAGQYDIYYKIGQGSTAKVYLASNKQSGETVALKVIRLPEDEFAKQEKLAQIRNEVNIMSVLEHPGIVSIKDFFIENNKIYVAMEFVGNGSLELYIHNRPMDIKTALKYFSQIADAVFYLHTEAKIVHRDLKAENILLTDCHQAKLSDFGLSRYLPQDHEVLMKTRCGSPCYVAPEVITSQGYSEKSDIWSLGILLFYMVTGHYPFIDENIQRLFHKILEEPVPFPDFLKNDSELIDLLNGMLQKEEKNRFTITQVVEHSCLKRLCTNKSVSLPHLNDYVPTRRKISSVRTIGTTGAFNVSSLKNAASIMATRRPKVMSLAPSCNMHLHAVQSIIQKKNRRRSIVLQIAAPQ
ncbi:CBL-interacting serine/threonine-protein kinase 9-like protein [Tritrichomonas foetus]|uniref:CBL-interacting serine/threonine-protein kinase 9-like protein n=1 Tax=Tritrichomonas foetus TaxID=1144522 RepID=A0A1J4JPB7_9EUKA|nr:CBL-interacting serine/threonine-protein kinase 9-like protein [Tritrichomonas foetus]|eukprot:OHT00232.1 CBL-interacting serine/threonine-protein kinase 9-like protein [Tritrichomonas foetus]